MDLQKELNTENKINLLCLKDYLIKYEILFRKTRICSRQEKKLVLFTQTHTHTHIYIYIFFF